MKSVTSATRQPADPAGHSTATPEEAAGAHAWIRTRVAERDGKRAQGLRILYGGSVKPGNIGGLLASPDVDGALVGGASLDPETFAALIGAEARA